MSHSWTMLGTADPQSLTETRLQLHYAIQLIAIPAKALLPALSDESQISLTWGEIGTTEVFIGGLIPADQLFQVALDPGSLTLHLVNKGKESVASFSLQGQTFTVALEWLKQKISQRGASTQNLIPISYPDDFPVHSIAQGDPFANASSLHLSELAAYYSNTFHQLQKLLSSNSNASPLRIWPHHFDLASLIDLPANKNGEAQTVGVGFSPGDQSYLEPYWYVSPYPYPDIRQLPQLSGGGEWHTQGWVGGVLRSRILISQPADAQSDHLMDFLVSAIRACQSLLLSE